MFKISNLDLVESNMLYIDISITIDDFKNGRD
jgi:hypothetical protein